MFNLSKNGQHVCQPDRHETMRPKIYACYSDSHLPLLEQHFLPSLPGGFDLVLRHVPQSCPAATYNAAGWGLAMRHKVAMILDALATEKDPFVVSDVDVRFYVLQPAEISVLARSCDVAYQLDLPISESLDRGPKYCAGFSVLTPSPLTLDLYQRIFEAIPLYNTEQEALYASIVALAASGLRVCYLSPERFWCLKHGSPGPKLAIDHASWVNGVQAKLAHLQRTFWLWDLRRGRAEGTS